MADKITEYYPAVVEKIISDGKHGPYAVARSNEIGPITFSLDSKVWQENKLPKLGMWIVLSKVRKKPAGWRAYNASCIRAIVQKVVESKHGPYAVAISNELGLVTFSLEKKVWRENDQPERGIYVILLEIAKKLTGWRAFNVRYVGPADEQLNVNQN